MAIPNAKNAVVEASKVRDYLLNPAHPDGGTKAKWFESLGYKRHQWQVLADDLLAIAQTSEDFVTEQTAFGLKYIVIGPIGQTDQGLVLTVWIIEDDDPPRLVTAYPVT